MNLRYQAIYQIVCEEMNMTRAAERLDMSQPAISQVIRDIENHFELKMFERKAKQLYLTDAGNKLLMYTNELMKVHDAMEVGMESLLTASIYAIGIGYDVSTNKVSEWIDVFKHIHEETMVTLNTLKTDQIIEQVKDRKLDIGIITEHIDHEQLNCELLHEESTVIICRESGILEELRTSLAVRKRDAILNIPLIVHTELSSIEEELMSLLKEKGIYQTVTGQYAHSRGILDGVSCNLGLAILPKSLWESYESSMQTSSISVEIPYKLYRLCRKEKNSQIDFGNQ